MHPRKAHFIGIAGKGMSATALLLRQQGTDITGSDEGFYPPVSDYLARAGIAFHSGYKKEHIPADADLIVIGKNAKLVPESNEEVRAAFASGIRVASFPDVISGLAAATDNIVVAGSYGKSTTTALVAWSLAQAGKDPSYFIGEVTKGFAAYAHLGTGGVFVLEGDEYPSANWDPKAKFLHYRPRSVLLTSATHDHVNVYPTHEAYLAPFKELVAILPRDGLLVVNAGEPFARALASGYAGKQVLYGLERGQYYAANIAYGAGAKFDLMRAGSRIVSLATPLLGAHNVENIVGASAVLLEKELITPASLAAGVGSFQGVKRRMEQLSPASRVPVLEGFGSSYEKARSAIAAARRHFPSHRLLVVFEPHSFTWRNRGALPLYDDVFAGAQRVLIYEPAVQGAATHAQLAQDEIVRRVRAAGFDVHAIHGASDGLETIDRELAENDCVLLLSSGDLGGLIKSVPALVEKRFPA
jgi:UDP-N-acetylmuramate: L-alanyl-gamma-D-glutamyl-meso-diaminopimelate ligase